MKNRYSGNIYTLLISLLSSLIYPSCKTMKMCMNNKINNLIPNQLLLVKNDTAEINWECIFLPDNGAFFINYVTTSALIGTGLEIIRFPELLMYSFRLAFARCDYVLVAKLLNISMLSLSVVLYYKYNDLLDGTLCDKYSSDLLFPPCNTWLLVIRFFCSISFTR